MLSWLKQKYLALELKVFRSQFENHCLVWEPGAWRPPRKTGATVVSTVSQSSATSNKNADALVLLLPPQKPQLTLGREPSCDLLIDDATVSASHLVFSLKEGAWWVRGLGSTNGTWLNQQPLQLPNEVVLKSDDVVRVGEVNLTFYDPKGLYFRLKANA
jgi:pSer/pThr/pTyr-binding forkhead associated (FHA) protein